MVKAYEIRTAGGRTSSNSTVLIACDSPTYDQSEDGPVEDPASYVSEAARRCFEHRLQELDDATPLLEELKNTEIQSNDIESGVIAADTIFCVFDTFAEPSLKWAKLTETTIEADRSEKGPFMELLDAETWTYLANTWDLDTNPRREIQLFSSKTFVTLRQFKDSLESLVDGNLTPSMDDVDIDAIKETIFWQCMVKTPKAFSLPTGSNYTHVLNELDELDERWSAPDNASSNSHTFPRINRRRPGRPRPSLDFSQLYIPRTMPGGAPISTDKYNKNWNNRHESSETSDSNE